LFSGGGLGWFWFVLGSSCCQVVWSWLCFAVLGLPLVMEGDYGDFDEKSFHPKSSKIPYLYPLSELIRFSLVSIRL
jgi:hypothetical protein